VSGSLPFKVISVLINGTFTHNGFPDNNGGALCLFIGRFKGIEYFLGIVSVDGNYIPVPGLVLLGCIFGGNSFAAGGKLDII